MQIRIPKLIGHRGACGYAPENTLKSFRLAKQLGATMVEFDVGLCKDGIPVVIHDDTVDRTTNGKGTVKNISLPELQALDAGERERISTLEEVMQCLAEEKLMANVEIKPCPGIEKETVNATLEILNRWKEKVSIVISSFDLTILTFIREQSDLALAALFSNLSPDWMTRVSSLKCLSINLGHYLLPANDAERSKAIIQQIHGQHYLLLCYTVNDNARAQQLFSWGVDGLFTNYLDKLAC
jgi:glycerophosphoryl diester phosphodiesterase